MGELDGRVAIVTGAGHGIGRGIASELAREGASVIVNDLGGDYLGHGADTRPAAAVAEEIVAAGGTALADHGDVADAETGTRMVEQAVREFGGLHVLVNTAGILRDKMIFSMAEDDWDAVIRVHLRGHFVTTSAACRYWRQASKEAGGPIVGRVVNFASESGIYGNLGQTNYAAAKAGIISFSTAVAREMGKYGVTSNTIAPRARTRMVEATIGGILPETKEDAFDRWAPANVAPAVTYLASDAGGAYTGQLLVVGGGVVQVIEPFTVAREIKFVGAPPSPEEVGELLADVRGPSAGPPGFPIPIEL
jgi:NAD(P)-dependent dehydrogenase (short-subunit alcohol dehydrogenase family)